MLNFGRTLAVAPFAVGLMCASAFAEPLGDTIRFMLSNHPEFFRERAVTRAAKEDIDQARSGFFPKIDLTGNVGVELTDSPSTRGRGNGTVRMLRSEASGLLTQMLFDGFETASRVEGSLAQHRVADYRMQVTAERLAFQVTEVYLDVLRTRRLAEIAKANVAEHRKVFGNLDKLRQSGVKTALDVDRVATRLSRAERDLEDALGARRVAEARFSEVVGRAPTELEQPAALDYKEPMSADLAMEHALANNPIVKVAREALNASKAEHELSRASYFPRLDLELSGSTADNQDGVSGQSTDFTAMVRMRFNLFDGFATTSGSRRTFDTARAAAEDEGETRRNMREITRTAMEQLLAERSRVKPLKAGLAISKNVAAAYQEQFILGDRSLIDLLDAATETFTFGSDLVDAEFGELLAIHRLAYRLGGYLKYFDVEIRSTQTASATP